MTDNKWRSPTGHSIASRETDRMIETPAPTETLATEAEQLRKERDELAKAVLLADYQGVDDDTLKLAKRIIENG